MKSELGFEFADLKKALSGWVDMVQAFKARLREDVATDSLVWVLLQATCGCAILISMLAMIFLALLSASAWGAWKFFEPVLPENVSQRQWQPTNETSSPI